MGRIVEHWFHPNHDELIKRKDLTLIVLSKKSMRLTPLVANLTSYPLESQLLPKANSFCRAGISATTIPNGHNTSVPKNIYLEVRRACLV
ncbi:hypothetical protein QYF36_014951 [Acer negundo]|nr:hypothetical protein QYF36_014951 [Acer negundo]